MRRLNVFIGSSAEKIEYIEAVQLNLKPEKDLNVVCWHQGVFKISEYALTSLTNELMEASFGIFFLSDDDYVRIRKKEYKTVRDNVLFELGMFLGALGLERTYIIVPSGGDYEFRIPSDLKGINTTSYDVIQAIENLDAALGPACTEIKRKIRNQQKKLHNSIVVEKFGLCNNFDAEYDQLFRTAERVSTYFVHSRRWRETNLNNIKEFFQRKSVRWDVFLPDIQDAEIITQLEKHFDDGDSILIKILDAFKFFLAYSAMYPSKIVYHVYCLYPTYSFYKFDNNIIVSMYPLSGMKQSTPTLKTQIGSSNIDFFACDIARITKDSKLLTVKQVNEIISKFN